MSNTDYLLENIPTQFETFWSQAKKAPSGSIDVIDMFSGCGGMSAGFLALNGYRPAFRLLSGLDVDEVANRTYMHNINAPGRKENVAELSSRPSRLKAFMKSVGRCEGNPLVLIGCSPCQGFSSHRNSAGEGDTRNSLFADFAQIAARLKPDAVVIENVPELLTDRYWPLVESGQKILRRAGYYVHVGVHNVAEFGVPQERFRALIIAMQRPFAPLTGFLSRPSFRTVRQAIGQLQPIPAGGSDSRDPMHYTVRHKPSTIETIKRVPLNGGNRPSDVGPECLRRAFERQGRGAYDDVYGRLRWDKPSITITAYARNPASGRFVHPDQHRGLSVREAAILQSFPKDYWFAGTLDERFRQIGNAVPPLFASAVAAHVLNELKTTRESNDDFNHGISGPVGPSFSRMIPALKAGFRTEKDLVSAC
jgi:DNA (cytosine-5)-methyltransferase 1